MGILLLAVALAAAAVPPDAVQANTQADQLKKDGKVPDAEQAYRKAIQIAPTYALAHNNLGSLLFESGRIPEAVTEFNEATRDDPTYGLAWFNLGFASRKSGNFPQAITAYRTYTKLSPDDTDGWYGLGEACRNAGQRECAVEGYQTYLNKEKRPTEQKWIDKANGYLAQLKSAAPAPAAAAPSVAAAPVVTTTPPPAPGPAPLPPPSAVGGSPTSSNPVVAAKIKEGDQLFANRQYRDALFSYQDAVNADSSNIEALFDLGKTYATMGYFQQAIDRWQRVASISNDPGVKQRAQENIAKAQAKLGQAATPQASPMAGTAGANAAPISNPDQARSKYEQGVSLINQRNYQGAVDALNDALQSNPTYSQALVARGSAHVGLRQYPEAVADYQSALRIDSTMATPLFGVAEALRAMGRKQDAATYYQRYADSRAPDVSADLQREARSRVVELSR